MKINKSHKLEIGLLVIMNTVLIIGALAWSGVFSRRCNSAVLKDAVDVIMAAKDFL